MDKKIKLTNLTKSSGWAAKIGPDVLAQVLCQLPKVEDERLLIGLNTSDDAAAYKLNEDTAIIQTLDFFTPVVDNPYTFGQIAATNSLSDVYAMGAEPIMAMNIVCFPGDLDPNILAEILKGGQSKVEEANALLVGGHTVEDSEPKYGLSVTGICHPDEVLSNANAKVGDLLVLTKPLGLGIINTAIKADLVDEVTYNEAIKVMTELNKYGKDAVMLSKGVNSMTDITGFGLLGHSLEMAEGSGVTLEINSKSVPIIDKAIEFAKMGLVPAGSYSNKSHVGNRIIFKNIKEHMKDILFDPQTSGGLLISIKAEDVEILKEELEKRDVLYAVIGRVVEKEEATIIVY